MKITIEITNESVSVTKQTQSVIKETPKAKPETSKVKGCPKMYAVMYDYDESTVLCSIHLSLEEARVAFKKELASIAAAQMICCYAYIVVQENGHIHKLEGTKGIEPFDWDQFDNDCDLFG